MFGGCSLCGSEERMYLICHVTLQDQMIKGSHDFRGGSSLNVMTPPGLVAIGVVIADIYF